MSDETENGLDPGDVEGAAGTAPEAPEGATETAPEAPEAAAEANEGGRRRSRRREAPSRPSGWRSSRRGSKGARTAKKAQAEHEVKTKVADAADTVGRYAWVTWRMTLSVIGVVLAVGLGLVMAASGVNSAARWWARRQAAMDATPAGQAEKARENLLIIAKEGDRAYGFLALRVDSKEQQVWGLAIPAAVFVEVPGQGFEKVGDSLKGGPEVSMSAISNFLGVRFEQYVIVDKETYQSAMERQSVGGIIPGMESGNLDPDALSRFASVMNGATGSRIGLAPLPVKPISLGEEEYLEAETAKVADLLEEWWGVTPEAETERVRVIVYNGAGSPGIAGTASKQLIEAGMRIVGTGNADNFNYRSTIITVHNGDAKAGEQVRAALGGIGKVSLQESSQKIADVIVIIGKDYAPADKDG